MGYLVKSSFPAFSKLVASIWFWLPPGAKDFASGTSAPMAGDLPLLTFGSRSITDLNDDPLDPSFIAINCRNPNMYLSSFLQTNIRASGIEDDQLEPAWFDMSGFFGAGTSSDNCIVVPSVWQHALVSFDISGGCVGDWSAFPPGDPVYSSSNKFSWSLNNVSKNNETISASDQMDDRTSILSRNACVDYPGNNETATLAGTVIPSGAFAIPIDSGRVVRIKMAKLQVWTNRYIDAGTVSNRRMFIDASGRPVPRATAAATLGPPSICFDTQDDWINAHNRGTAGSFTKTGTISKASPGAGL